MPLTRYQSLLIRNRENLSYHENPFRGEINPGTSEGLKLFLNATKTLNKDEMLDLKTGNAKALMDHLVKACSAYGWNKLVDRVNIGTQETPNFKTF